MKAVLFLASFLAGYFGQEITRPSLTERELVEIVADFQINQIIAPPGLSWYGMTDFDSRRMWIVSDADITQRRRTAIHEALHVALRMRGDAAYGDEEVIQALTESEYKRLFGGVQ